MSFYDEISARLASLTGNATPREVRAQLNEFDARDTQAVRISEGGGSSGNQAVGCVLLAQSIDLTGVPAGYFVWNDGIYDNPYDANTIDVLPDGIGIDPNSLATDTLVTTEAGVWAFTADAIAVPNDNTFSGQVTFGNMNICEVFDVPVSTANDHILSPSAVYNLPAGAGFSLGILTMDAPTSNPFNCGISGLIVVRLA